MGRVRLMCAVGALLLTACSAPPAATGESTTTPASEAAETVALIGGGTLAVDALERGPQVLWFWAPG